MGRGGECGAGCAAGVRQASALLTRRTAGCGQGGRWAPSQTGHARSKFAPQTHFLDVNVLVEGPPARTLGLPTLHWTGMGCLSVARTDSAAAPATRLLTSWLCAQQPWNGMPVRRKERVLESAPLVSLDHSRQYQCDPTSRGPPGCGEMRNRGWRDLCEAAGGETRAPLLSTAHFC